MGVLSKCVLLVAGADALRLQDGNNQNRLQFISNKKASRFSAQQRSRRQWGKANRTAQSPEDLERMRQVILGKRSGSVGPLPAEAAEDMCAQGWVKCSGDPARMFVSREDALKCPKLKKLIHKGLFNPDWIAEEGLSMQEYVGGCTHILSATDEATLVAEKAEHDHSPPDVLQMCDQAWDICFMTEDDAVREEVHTKKMERYVTHATATTRCPGIMGSIANGELDPAMIPEPLWEHQYKQGCVSHMTAKMEMRNEREEAPELHHHPERATGVPAEVLDDPTLHDHHCPLPEPTQDCMAIFERCFAAKHGSAAAPAAALQVNKTSQEPGSAAYPDEDFEDGEPPLQPRKLETAAGSLDGAPECLAVKHMMEVIGADIPAVDFHTFVHPICLQHSAHGEDDFEEQYEPEEYHVHEPACHVCTDNCHASAMPCHEEVDGKGSCSACSSCHYSVVPGVACSSSFTDGSEECHMQCEVGHDCKSCHSGHQRCAMEAKIDECIAECAMKPECPGEVPHKHLADELTACEQCMEYNPGSHECADICAVAEVDAGTAAVYEEPAGAAATAVEQPLTYAPVETHTGTTVTAPEMMPEYPPQEYVAEEVRGSLAESQHAADAAAAAVAA